MAEETVSVIVGNRDQRMQEVRSLSDKTAGNEAARWNDYGIGLIEQTQYGQAAAAFKKASELDPSNPDYPVSAAIAELRMERYAFNDQYQLLKAKELVDNALKLSPEFPRALFYRAIILRALGKNDQAGAIFAGLVKKHPLDREIWRQYGQTVYSAGQIKTAKTAFETILKIDPTDAGAWQFLSPIYFGEGKGLEGENAQNLYLLWRDDPVAESVAARFYQTNPNWVDVRIPFHAYSDNSPLRPTMTGNSITPDK
jgi:tetratricopeptide (TPR) repeat protein